MDEGRIYKKTISIQKEEIEKLKETYKRDLSRLVGFAEIDVPDKYFEVFLPSVFLSAPFDQKEKVCNRPRALLF